MNLRFLILTVLIGTFFLPIHIYAQDGRYVEVQDLESWTSGQVKYKLHDQWTFGIKGQVRLDNDASTLKNYIGEFETKYNATDALQFGVGLRYTYEDDTEGDIQGDRYYFRYNLDAIYKHKVKRFDLQYRLRYQNKNEVGISSLQGDQNVHDFRFKTGIEYNIRKWKLDPELSAEIFNHYEKKGQSNGFDTFRVTAGTSYKIKNWGKIGMYYRIDQEISSYYPKTTNIIMLNYSYTIKSK